MRLTLALTLALALTLVSQAKAQLPSLTLDWTAPGDDDGIGTATAYDVRYSVSKPDTTSAANMNTWWAGATVVTGLPAPLIVGSPQTTTLSPAGGFTAGNTYYFVLRTRDEVGNWSTYSNVAFRQVLDVTPPRGVVDLRVR